MEVEKGKRCFQRFRNGFFCGVVFSVIIITFIGCNKNTIVNMWNQKQGRVNITYDRIQSKLDDKKKCYLCGDNDRSLMGYYRNTQSIGLISINDWYVIDLELKASLDGVSTEGTRSTITSQGDMSYIGEATPSRGMASLIAELPDNYNVDTTIIQHNLCQNCLKKVTASLSYSKWKYEKKNPIPLCIVDFQTLEIYSLQDWHKGFSVRDYWVNLFFSDKKVEIYAYDLPKR